MSERIDSKVVEMRFDNKQFERETKNTLGTLSKLKEALKIPGAEKSLQNVDKAAKSISFDGLSKSVEILTNRFSTFGIMGMRVIQNVTDALMNKLASALHFVDNAIVSGGIRRAMNIENAHFQLQALLKDEIKVQAVMDNAMESVDGTAYAYDEAAKAASMFAASGVQAGEEMLQALKGITGVAAMTNSDFASIAMIFTTIAGNGRVMGDQLLQFSARGLNAASKVAEYLREVEGQAEITESTVREMVSDGQISFKLFSDAMTWAFGDSAKRANETFSGSMSNMKSALARIGADFVSPLLEQNGELVNLFNALRVKINEVRSTITFDEQKSAIAGLNKEAEFTVETISELTKLGEINFDRFTTAILGTAKSEEELNEINSKLAVSFGDVMESGFASNETLMEIKRNGIDAYGALVDYINGVTKGTIKTSHEMKSVIKELTNGVEVNSASVIRFAREGKISFDVFNNAIVNYSGLVTKESTVTADALKAMFDIVKSVGNVSNSMLVDMNKNGIKAATAMIDYLNGVNEGTIRASYSTKKEIEEMTGGIKVSTKELRQFADEGKLSFAIFQSAMENSFGSTRSLAKQFTDYVLDNLRNLVRFINGLDVMKPMDAFYNGVESVKNITKGLLSVVKPVGKAFGQVFSGFSVDDVINITAKIEQLTAKLRLSEKGSENLTKAFKGVFDIIKLVIDIIGKFVSALNPSIEPVGELGEGMLGLAGSMGESLSKFAEWVRQSEGVNRAIEGTAGFVLKLIDLLKQFKNWIGKTFTEVKKSPITEKVLNSLGKGLNKLAEGAKSFKDTVLEGFKEIPKLFASIFGGESEDDVGSMAEGLDGVQNAADKLSFEKPIGAFEKLTEAVGKLRDLLMGNKGINAFVTNVNEFFNKMIDAFKVETLREKINLVTSTLDDFIGWCQKNAKPLFGDMNLGGVIGTASSIGMVYSILKMAKAFEGVANKIKAIPDIMGPIKSTLTAYQKDLKANQLIKIAGAIGILATALVFLSFADWGQIWKAAIALASVSGIILWASSKFLNALNKANEIPDALSALAGALNMAAKKFGRAAEFVAIGWMVKDFAKSILLVAGSLAAIYFMYKKDAPAFQGALTVVTTIGGIIIGIVSVFVGVSKSMDKFDSLGIASMTGAMLSLAISLGVMVSAMKKLLKMDMPTDWQSRLAIIVALMLGMVGMFTALGAVSSLTHGNPVAQATPIIALAGALYLCVVALNKMFKIDIPKDWEAKCGIFIGLLVAMGLMFFALSAAGDKAKGAVKAGGTLLGMAGLLVATTFALLQLIEIPGNQLFRAVMALGGTILALAVVFSKMKGVGGDKDTGKSVLYMAAVIVAAAGSLSVLSMIPIELLAKSVAALGAILLALALVFNQISKIKNDKALWDVLAMIGVIAAATTGLMFLAEKPWDSLLAGAGALSMVLLAFGRCMRLASGIVMDVKLDHLWVFIGELIALGSAAAAIYMLSSNPWDSMLAAGIALGGVLLAFGKTFEIMGQTVVETDWKAVPLYIGLVLGMYLITDAIGKLSQEYSSKWENLIASGIALSITMLAFAKAAEIIAGVRVADIKTAISVIGIMDLLIIDIGGLLWVAGELDRKFGVKDIMEEGVGTLAVIAKGIGYFVSSLIEGFTEGVAKSIERMGTALSVFIENSKTFWANVGLLDKDATEAVKNLAEMMVILLAKDILEALTLFINKGQTLAEFGLELEAFGPHIKKFAESIDGIKAKDVKTAANVATIMAELYDKLPTVGGMSVLLFGSDYSLSKFGLELALFGPKVKEFADSVIGIDTDGVEAAKNAGAIMGELKKQLPRIGGITDLVFGAEQNLSAFGVELALFGPKVKEFAESVEGIGTDSVEAVYNIGTMMTTLQSEFPEIGGLWQFLFGGKVTMTQFSTDLINFGTNMVAFAAAVETFDGTKIEEVIASVQNLADLAKYVNSEDTRSSLGIVKFAADLEFLAIDAVDKFVAVFENSDEKVKTALATMVGYAVEAAQNGLIPMNIAAVALGSTLISGVSTGIDRKSGEIKTKVETLATSTLEKLRSVFTAEQMRIITQNALTGMMSAISSRTGTITTGMRNLGNSMISTIRASLPQSTFNAITQNALQGMVNGVNTKKPQITMAMTAICNTIVSNTRTQLPQATFQGFGSGIVMWMSMGITSQTDYARNAIAVLCAAITQATKDGLPASPFVQIGSSIASALIAGINSQAEQVVNASKNLVNIANQTMSDINSDLNKQAEEIAKAAQNTITEMNKTLSNPSTKKTSTSAGKNVTSGISKGITSGNKNVITATKKVAQNIQKTFKESMAIHSPSKVMEKFGGLTIDGLVEGIQNSGIDIKGAMDNIKNSMTESLMSFAKDKLGSLMNNSIVQGLGETTGITAAIDNIKNATLGKIDELKNSITGSMSDLDGMSFDINADVLPQVVLDDFTSNLALESLFNADAFSDSLSTSFGNAAAIQNQFNAEKFQNELQNEAIQKQLSSLTDAVQASMNGQTPTENTFYITGNDPTKIAEEVSRILQRQIERKENTWA